jgi:hypothetical protein
MSDARAPRPDILLKTPRKRSFWSLAARRHCEQEEVATAGDLPQARPRGVSSSREMTRFPAKSLNWLRFRAPNQPPVQNANPADLSRALVRPVVGGLFLAFPAIFPASATLIEKHVRERKEEAGLPGERRGKEAAALDAAGAALGSFGLAAFGLVVWSMIVQSPAWALVLAAASWLAVAVLAWHGRRSL